MHHTRTARRRGCEAAEDLRGEAPVRARHVPAGQTSPRPPRSRSAVAMEIRNRYLGRKGSARFPPHPHGQAPRSASARPPSRVRGRPDKGLRGGVQLSRPLPRAAAGPPLASGGGRVGGPAPGGRPGLPAAYLRPTARRRADTSLPGAGSGPGGGTEARRYGGGRSPGAASPSPPPGGGAADGGRGRPRPGMAPGCPCCRRRGRAAVRGPRGAVPGSGAMPPPLCSRAAPRLGVRSDLHFGR